MPDQPESNKKVPWGMTTGLDDPSRLDENFVRQMRETVYQIGRDLGLATKIAPEMKERYQGLRIKYTPRLNQGVMKMLWEYPDLQPGPLTAVGMNAQIVDIDGLLALKGAVDELSGFLGITITLRQGHLAERVNDGVMLMKEKVDEALRAGVPDRRLMAAYQPVVALWDKEVEKAQQHQQEMANATGRIEEEAAAWKAQAEAYKKQVDELKVRVQQMEARMGLPPVQVAPEAPTPPPAGKDQRKDRR
jgi:hypothetical protein